MMPLDARLANSTAAPAPVDSAPVASTRPPHTSALLRAYLPPFVFLAYTAFFITGFGTGLGALQPAPIYLFLCLVLLTLQEGLSVDRALTHVAYIFISSSFAIAYAGELVFHLPKLDFTRNPMTYIMLNIVLLAIFLVDLVNRRRQRMLTLEAGPNIGVYATIASDFAAAALFLFIAALLLDLLGSQTVLQHLGLPTHPPYVIVDLNSTLHLTLRSPLNQLEGLDFLLGLVCAAGAGVFAVVAGTLAPVGEEGEGTEARRVRELLRVTLEQSIFAIRMVLSPLIWLIPAFAVAFFAQVMARYFQQSAATKGSFLDLLNPFSLSSRASFGMGMLAVLLALLAVLGMLLAVALTEQSRHVFRRTLRVVETLGRGISLSLAFFMYTLALVNIVVVLLGVTTAKPFQVGLPGLLLLIVGIGWVIGEARSDATHPHDGGDDDGEGVDELMILPAEVIPQPRRPAPITEPVIVPVKTPRQEQL